MAAIQGRSLFDDTFETSISEYYSSRPEEKEITVLMFISLKQMTNTVINEVCNFSANPVICDLSGDILPSVLDHSPNPIGIQFQTGLWKDNVGPSLLNGRASMVTGNCCCESLPNADLFILRWVLHKNDGILDDKSYDKILQL